MTELLRALLVSLRVMPRLPRCLLGMKNGFGAQASHPHASTTAVDWPKVVVWLAMAVVGIGLWGFAGVALFKQFSHR
jgi:hypothetical protein